VSLDKNSPIRELHLPTRAQRALLREEIWTIGLLVERLDDIPYIQGLGTRSVSEVRKVLSEHGFL
jgi:DNA-directed RNA polymerase alpha subunit